MRNGKLRGLLITVMLLVFLAGLNGIMDNSIHSTWKS